MRFYYFSLIGTFLALAASGVLVTVFWLAWTKLAGRKLTNRVIVVSIPAALLLPWAEEFWIAWNFGQLCRKDAGLSINRTVEVEGFFDNTTHWWRQLKESSNYKFVESRDNVYGTLWRVERVGDDVQHFKIDKPTARYHYSRESGARAGYKVVKQESVVLDSQSGEALGRYARYSRDAPWLYVGLGKASYACDGPEGGPDAKHSFLIYGEILKPSK